MMLWEEKERKKRQFWKIFTPLPCLLCSRNSHKQMREDVDCVPGPRLRVSWWSNGVLCNSNMRGQGTFTPPPPSVWQEDITHWSVWLEQTKREAKRTPKILEAMKKAGLKYLYSLFATNFCTQDAASWTRKWICQGDLRIFVVVLICANCSKKVASLRCQDSDTECLAAKRASAAVCFHGLLFCSVPESALDLVDINENPSNSFKKLKNKTWQSLKWRLKLGVRACWYHGYRRARTREREKVCSNRGLSSSLLDRKSPLGDPRCCAPFGERRPSTPATRASSSWPSSQPVWIRTWQKNERTKAEREKLRSSIWLSSFLSLSLSAAQLLTSNSSTLTSLTRSNWKRLHISVQKRELTRAPAQSILSTCAEEEVSLFVLERCAKSDGKKTEQNQDHTYNWQQQIGESQYSYSSSTFFFANATNGTFPPLLISSPQWRLFVCLSVRPKVLYGQKLCSWDQANPAATVIAAWLFFVHAPRVESFFLRGQRRCNLCAAEKWDGREKKAHLFVQRKRPTMGCKLS